MPTFETALSASDWGAYNYGVLILCGLCAVAEAAIALSVPITLPLAKCDLRLTENHMLWLISIASLGMAFGGYVIGSLSDVSGRKCIIPFSMLIMFTGGIGSSFSSSFHMMLVCILIMGIGMGSHSYATRIFLAEILPKEKRGPLLVVLEVFWDLGVLMIGSLAWVLLPSALLYAVENFRPNSWRVMLAMCSCMSIIVACLTGILNPSPRYLLVKQKYNAAIDVFRQMFAINTSSHVDSYQIPDMSGTVEEDPEPDIEGTLCTEYILNALRRIHTLTGKIFKKYRKQTLLCIVIHLALFPGLIMSILWMREIMNWPGSYYFTGQQLSWNCNATGKLLLLPDDCAETVPSLYVYLDFVILAGSMLVADFLLIFFIDRAGHRMSLVIAFIGASVCSSVLPFNIPSIARIIVCCLFIASYTAATSAFTVITIEIFPTPIRGTANGLIPMLSRILCMLVKIFVQTTCDIPLFVMAGLTFVAAALSWFLPDLTRKPMQEGVSQPQEL